MTIFLGIIELLSGLGAFLTGLKLTSDNLKQIAGDKASNMLAGLPKNRFVGVGIGICGGFILQSSSATTVLLIGLVDAGLLSLFQAACIIMGSNIGTTLTVLAFSLSFLPIGTILGVLSLVGALLVMLTRKDKTRRIGLIMAGIGLIFVGLGIMGDGAEVFASFDKAGALFSGVSNPILLFFVGMVFTALIQSGSATTGMVIALCSSGLMPWISACYIIVGGNVGSCVTALLSTPGSGISAKRTAILHLLFNAFGAVLLLPLMVIFGGKIGESLPMGLSPSELIAIFSIIFNLATALALLPFVKNMVDLAVCMVPEGNFGRKKAQQKSHALNYRKCD